MTPLQTMLEWAEQRAPEAYYRTPGQAVQSVTYWIEQLDAAVAKYSGGKSKPCRAAAFAVDETYWSPCGDKPGRANYSRLSETWRAALAAFKTITEEQLCRT
jgi:hypothetical protein